MTWQEQMANDGASTKEIELAARIRLQKLQREADQTGSTGSNSGGQSSGDDGYAQKMAAVENDRAYADRQNQINFDRQRTLASDRSASDMAAAADRTAQLLRERRDAQERAGSVRGALRRSR